MKRIDKSVWQLSAMVLFVFSNTLFVSAQGGWTLGKLGEIKKELTAVYFTDSKHGFIGGEDGLLLYTETGGVTWKRKSLTIQHTINDIYFRNKENGFILAGNTILTTIDNGETWRELATFKPADFKGATPELYSIRFGSKKNGWIVGSVSRRDEVVDSLFLYTEDGGASWQRRSLPTEKELVHLDFVSDERGWVVGANGIIVYTEDGGVSWKIQNSGTKIMINNVDFHDKKKGWAVGQKGTLLRTTDGGINWIAIATPTNGALYSVKFINEDTGWIAGRDGSIFFSDDGGKSWTQEISKTKNHLYALFMDKKWGWAVGDAGTLVQYTK